MKSMHDISLSDVKDVLTVKGYHTISAEGQPNIVGIRNADRNANDYSDLCWVWWTENGVETAHNYTITTVPGFYYRQHPISGTDGTGILVPGQYIACWELGMHRNTQLALCQHCGPVKVYRDNNKDLTLDYDPKTIQEGFFGIDLHHGALDDNDVVDRWSAGCQVWRYHLPHEDLMNTFKDLSGRNHFTRFSYTLLNQEDFNS